MEIIVIVAMAKNRVIGRDNDIPWHLPGEQQRFKKITMGHALVMGRKTYESIGRPLPGRTTVIITRQKDYTASGCRIAHSLKEAIQSCARAEKVFIAGGEGIFREGLSYADAIYLTELERDVEGDIFFPEFDPQAFTLLTSERVEEDEEPYTFYKYQRLPACSGR